MAASSSAATAATSSQCPCWKYDVFLSFRGEDTRKTFTGHLYEGLKNKGIFTFQDDQRLEHGTIISKELLKAIEESQIAIIIFSKNYATSRWCLDELVKIMECRDEYKQIVIPVFYDVDPSEVRNQRENFAEAFTEHESKYKDDVEGMQKVKRWRRALTAAANLKGCDIRDGIESESIQMIVGQVSSKLCMSTSSSYLRDIVGIEAHLKKVKSLLEMEMNDVRIVGIWGLGGVGKTTVARAIFDTLSDQFEAACFLADVKENEKKNQLHSLQNTLLSELLRTKQSYVNNKHAGKLMIPSRLCSKKVLIVLDDIDHRDHLEYLAGDIGWFGDGSRVVITTRDSHLIEEDNMMYEVTTLPEDEAMKLFNRHAFKKNEPDERFRNLSLEVVNQAKGLPLALKVWGSFLYKRGLTEWRSAVLRMKKNSSSEIVEKLKISYDGLESEEQEIFLDIACFFRGYYKETLMEILESCDFRAHIGLDVLVKKSLVFISKGWDGSEIIEMHDLIQEMGRYVVNMQKNPGECSRLKEPEKRSRLWLVEDLEVVSNNTRGMKTVEAIVLEDPPELLCLQKALKNMNMLRMLHIKDSDFNIINEEAPLIKDGSIKYLSNSLRSFVWEGYPWESLPADFEPKRLIYLKLWKSSLYHLWTKTKDLRYLRTLDLSFSAKLKQTPDFTGMPNLEYVDLACSKSLEEVHSSLGNCNKLIHLDLSYCGSLKRFPLVNVESLEFLDLRKCKNLEKFPKILGRMKMELEIFKNIRGTRIRELPSSIKHQTHLIKLDLNQQYSKLDRGLERLPKEIGELVNLEWLDASNTLISQPPPSIVRLNKLQFLSFAKEPPPSIVRLNKLKFFSFAKEAKYDDEDEEHFVFPPVAEGLRSLEELDLSYCHLIEGGLPKDIICLSSLKKLNLQGNSFEHLPQSIGQLGGLRYLDLSGCKRLKELPDITGIPNLETLDLSGCTNLKEVHHSVGYLKELTKLNLSGCFRLKKLPDYTGMLSLETLDVSYCRNLEEVHHSIGYLKKLTRLNLCSCERLKRFPAMCIDSLECLNLRYCHSLEKFPEIFGSMKLELEIHMLNSVIRDLHSIIELRQNVYSDPLSQRMFRILHSERKIPSWFDHQGTNENASINLPQNWYDCDNFLGIVVCYTDCFVKITAELIPLYNDGMTHKLALCNHLEFPSLSRGLKLFLVPIAGLWDTSEASLETPNGYGVLRLSFSEIKEFGFRLLYKDEPGAERELVVRNEVKIMKNQQNIATG